MILDPKTRRKEYEEEKCQRLTIIVRGRFDLAARVLTSPLKALLKVFCSDLSLSLSLCNSGVGLLYAALERGVLLITLGFGVYLRLCHLISPFLNNVSQMLFTFPEWLVQLSFNSL